MSIPIYILSKGRYNTATTPALLEEAGFSYTLIVEKQEYAQYSEKFPLASFLVLPESHQGIAYVRNWLLEYEYSKGGTWYWMIDDDILHFWEATNGIGTKAGASVLREAEKITKQLPISQFSLSRHSNSWEVQKRGYTLNRDCYVVVCNHAQRVYPTAKYRVGVHEDTDLSLQLICAGHQTCLLQHYGYHNVRVGSIEGGLHEEYAQRKNTEWALRMCEIWGPEIITLEHHSSTRVGARINWKFFSSREAAKRGKW